MKQFLFQIQFIAIMVHAFQLLFIDCNYPRAFVWWIGMHAVMFFFLFNEFYKETYKKRVSTNNALILRTTSCKYLKMCESFQKRLIMIFLSFFHFS